MNGTPMVESDSLKFLGYILDSKGLWSAHIDYVVAQSQKRVGALRRICDYLSPADLCSAYKAFVHPQLEYGYLLYWGAAESHLLNLTESSFRLKGCLVRFLYLLWNLVELLLLWD